MEKKGKKRTDMTGRKKGRKRKKVKYSPQSSSSQYTRAMNKKASFLMHFTGFQKGNKLHNSIILKEKNEEEE